MNSQDLRRRTQDFALRTIRLAGSLPNNRVGDVLGRQVVKAGTSVGANYCEAQRASSKRHFVSTLEISLREADETTYWLELIAAAGLVKPRLLQPLIEESKQLVSIFAAAVRTAKSRPTRQPT
jgi:four helix bundle protein